MREWIEAKRSDLLDGDYLARRKRQCYALKERWRVTDDDVEIVCSRSRYQHEDESGFKHRGTFLDFSRNGQLFASAEFEEWDAVDPGFTSGTDFVDGCDVVSSHDVEMASFVTNNWDDYDHPLDYGSIAIFHRLVITAETSVVWEAITATIRTEFKKSSMLLLKPFPLEWEGEVTPENEEAFVRRQSAMKRYYRRTLGVQTIDGDPGVWMWKPILGPDPEPGRSMAVQEREKHLRAKYG